MVQNLGFVVRGGTRFGYKFRMNRQASWLQRQRGALSLNASRAIGWPRGPPECLLGI